MVFYSDHLARVPEEAISFAAGQCVHYGEDYDDGNTGTGAYTCNLTIVAPAFELHVGGGPLPTPAAVAKAAMTRSPSPNTPIGGSPATSLPAGEGLLPGGSGNAAQNELSKINDLSVAELLAIAKAVNPLNGQTNCTHITEAVIARLRGTDPNAVASPDAPTRTLKELEALHNTTVEFGKDFYQVFNEFANSPDGSIGIIVIIDLFPNSIFGNA